MVEVEIDGAHHLLPPQQAIRIPAGLPHRTTLRRVRTVSVFFAPTWCPGPSDRARVLPAAPVVREMILYGARWPITRPRHRDDTADAYFRALALVVGRSARPRDAAVLPTSRDPTCRRGDAVHLASTSPA